MNQDDRKKLGVFLKSLRKSHKLTQLDMAKIIDSTQGSVSKYEEGTMDLTAVEMIKIGKSLNIPLESFVKNYIDARKLVTHVLRKELAPFRIPKIYASHCIYNVRSLNPFIHFAKYKLTEDKFNRVVKNEMHLDPSYLRLMDAQLNSRFMNDLNSLVSFKDDEFQTFFTSFFKSHSHHGDCHDDFKKSKTPLDAVKSYVLNSEVYDCEFQRVVTMSTEKVLKVKYRKSNEFTLDKIVNDYHLKFLELMGKYGNSEDEMKIKKSEMNGTLLFEISLC
jgi:transcriptional regulator with XRE-family HTH domain